MTNHPNRSRRGRPPRDDGTAHRRVNISLPPDVHDRLKASPLGVSGEIARLVRDQIDS